MPEVNFIYWRCDNCHDIRQVDGKIRYTTESVVCRKCGAVELRGNELKEHIIRVNRSESEMEEESRHNA